MEMHEIVGMSIGQLINIDSGSLSMNIKMGVVYLVGMKVGLWFAAGVLVLTPILAIIMGLRSYYEKYVECLTSGKHLKTRVGLEIKRRLKAYHGIEERGEDFERCPLAVLVALISLTWPLTLLILGVVGIHKFILWRIRRKYKVLIMTHPDEKIREAQ